ncbi:MAG TPA: ATP-binding protein [Burkholderiales bacterium]|nr:ATP-binding protein [Burkholderiales bacterium]
MPKFNNDDGRKRPFLGSSPLKILKRFEWLSAPQWLWRGPQLRVTIVLAVAIGLVMPVYVSYHLTSRRHEQELVQQQWSDQQRLTELLAIGMQSPLWDVDPDAGRPLFKSIFGDRRVVAAAVYDDRGKVFLMKEYAERRTGRQRMLERDVVHPNKRTIGKVMMEMDSGDLDAALVASQRTIMLTVIGQFALSLILIVAVFRQRLLLPIQRLMRESELLARRDLGEPFVWLREDEIGSLGRSLEHTRRSLRTLFDEVETISKQLAIKNDELQRHRDHLEEIVKERTSELQAAKEQAEVASKAKSAFLANMSHELRTPLNAILGYAQILKQSRNLDDRQKGGVETIKQSGEHLLMLINDLLDLAKIESGKFELYPTTVRLSHFLRSLIEIIRIKAEEKQLTFSYPEPERFPWVVQVDDKRLRQVLLNLLGNAVKFTNHGSVSLDVRFLTIGDARARMTFEVRDTGIGIEKEALKSIFQPFEQVGDAQRYFGGTGLGLAITRQLVELMGGEIFVESQIGEGSRFGFDLAAPLSDIDLRPLGDSQSEFDSYQGVRRKVMIVDDVEANRTMLKDMLEPLGFHVTEARDGAQAVEIARTNPPDLVLMDMRMPGMSGVEATRQIHRIAGLDETPIIIISASASPAREEESLAAGAVGFMAKPVLREPLLRLLALHLKLDWMLGALEDEVSEKELNAQESRGRQSAPMLVPCEEEMAVLYELALAGNMRSIRNWANRYGELDDKYRPFADKLRELANGFQSEAILNLVEKNFATRPKKGAS